MKILIVLPAYNEEKILEENTIRVREYCRKNLSQRDWQILIIDNDSFDRTQEIGKFLTARYQEIKYLRLNAKGKGLAIRSGWQSETADIYTFMDADLSTDLGNLPDLINALTRDGFDLACGSRKLSGAKQRRSAFRKIFSWGYNVLVRLFFNLNVKDMACGFKAANQAVVEKVVPQVKSNAWFFDSELLILARKNGYKIKEIPVYWQESERESRLKALNLSWEYLKNLLELRWRLWFKH